MGSLELRGVGHAFGVREVLREVSLSIPAGSVLAVLGENGSGKSTLLRLIAGDIPLQRGEIRLNSENLRDLPSRARAQQVALVPQDEPLPFGLTVDDVVALGRLPHARGVWENAADWAAMQAAMSEVEILDLRARRMSELSGGQRQRVRVARARAQQATLLLMDEPTNHLDVRSSQGLIGRIKSWAAAGQTVIVATHDLNWAQAVADVALLLKEGQVIAQGDPVNVLHPEPLSQAFGVKFRAVEVTGGVVLVPANAEAEPT